jgi:hypothetical protein
LFGASFKQHIQSALEKRWLDFVQCHDLGHTSAFRHHKKSKQAHTNVNSTIQKYTFPKAVNTLSCPDCAVD